jgi:septum formation protein
LASLLSSSPKPGRYLEDELLILASASPRRHELLLAAGLHHLVLPSDIPEKVKPGESPTDFVQRLAQEKAFAVSADADSIVLGADTVVCLEEQIFGKPADLDEARRMLRSLSGRVHLVHTGICLRAHGLRIVDVASTEVEFVPLSEEEVEEYTRSGEGIDKAGAYAIQGIASRFIREIRGSYHNVVGLPVALVYSHLKSLRWL